VAIKGAGSFTPEDAELFSQLGRLRELKQLRSWVLDRDKVPAVVVMGESGVGKTSLLRAGLAFILNQGEKPIPHVYWEADPKGSRESLLRKIEAEFGTRNLEDLPSSVIVIDQLEQLDPERNVEFFQLLRGHLASEPPFRVTWILAFRREFGSTWLDFQFELPESCRHRTQMLSLRRFSVGQAKEVFATLAERADLAVRVSLVNEVLEQIAEGSISPVDLGITLQVLHRQPELAEDPAAFHSVGGHAGLLTLYLEMILEPHPPALREEVLRALLALVEEKDDRRLAAGRCLEELLDLVAPQVPRHLDVALEALAQPGVRVLETVEDTPRRYRLIHERFIPALRRLAGELLGAADRASRLLERRYQLWQREDRLARYLLRGRELREILRRRGSLRWGESREEKQRFLGLSHRRRYQRRLLAAVTAVLVALGAAWAIQEKRARVVQAEMFAWGLPKGTYGLLPRITDLNLPEVTNTRWVSRAVNLRNLSLILAPQYREELGQLTLDAGGSNWPDLPSSLQQLTLKVGGSGVSCWPALPSSLHASGSRV
ncbi:MAG: hypothetical protein GY856_07830, partial [bacterium]|nr:hypothetical protein [bacterium]